MTYEELVKLAKKTYEKADASAVKDHVAIQFNVTGEAEGAFYLEVKDGKVSVEPYEYYDRDVVVTAEDTVLEQIATGKLGLEAAYLTGKVKAEGNLKKALLLKELKAAAKKAPAKKEAAKKEVAPKKACAKKACAKKEEAPKKEAAKKAPAKKAPAKKEENK